MQVRSSFLRIILVLLALVSRAVWAQDGLPGAASKSAYHPGLRSSFTSRLVAADFDNDHKPDGALLLDAGVIDGQRMFRIELHVSASENRSLLFASNEAWLAISALDVNLDGIPDLVVEQAFTHKRLEVWLNDGHGRFRRARAEDFQALPDAPFYWQAPFTLQASVVAGLPSRLQTDQAFLLLEILRFGSSSSHWKNRPNTVLPSACVFSWHSPRAPPSLLSL